MLFVRPFYAAPSGGATERGGGEAGVLKRDFAIGVAWTAAANWVEQLTAVAVFLLIARLIGAEAFGIASMAFAFLFFGEVLVRDTLTEAIIASIELEEGRLEATLSALAGLAVAIALLLALAAVPVAWLYGTPQVAPLLAATSPTVLFIAAAGVPTALLRRRMAYRTLAIRSMAGMIAGGIAGVAMALQGFGAWSLVGQRLVQSGTNAVFAIGAAGWWPRRLPTRAELGLVRGLGPRVVALRALALAIMQTPTVALGVLAGPTAVGLFAFAFRLTDVVLALLVRPFKGVAQSAVAALRRQNGATAPFYLDLMALCALVAFAAFAGLGLVSGPAVEVLVGPDWAPAAAVLPFLCIFGAVSALTSLQESYLLALDRLQSFLRATLAEAMLGLVLVVPASAWGPVAAAAAVALRACAALPLLSAAAHAPEAIRARQLVEALVAPALLAAGMSIAVAAFLAASGGRLPEIVVFAGAVGIGIVAAAVLLFGLMPKTTALLRGFLRGGA